MKQDVTIKIEKKGIDVCVAGSDQSGSSISSSLLFVIGKVRHFNTVKNSNTTEAGHTQPIEAFVSLLW